MSSSNAAVAADPCGCEGNSLKAVLQRNIFCPVAGLLNGSTQSAGDLEPLLQRRLRASAAILATALTIVLLRLLLFPVPWLGSNWLLLADATVAGGLAVVAALLLPPRSYGRRTLRLFEGVVFGATALLLAWVQTVRGCVCVTMGGGHELAFVAETLLPWISLIYIYGLLIPNRGSRATLVVILMAATPLAIFVGLSWRYPHFAAILQGEGYWLQVALGLLIPVMAASYGAYRVNFLRIEASAARQIGSYTLEQRLGAGGMGEVFQARHRFLKRPCAVKLIDPRHADDPTAMARFEAEVQAASTLTHPNTIDIYDYGRTADGTFYYVMEFLPGLNTQQLVERHGPLPAGRTIHLLRQVCAALTEAHDRDLIHRDIKPANLFVCERGGVRDVVKLLDFGLVRSRQSLTAAGSDQELTREGTVVGSPLYIAPEHALGGSAHDARSDIYSLGAVAYWLLAAEPVFRRDNALKVLFAHAHDPVTPPGQLCSDIPADLERVVMRCLEKDPDDRFTTVRELDRALADCDAAGAWDSDDAARWWAGDRLPGDQTLHETDPRLLATVG